MGRDTTVPRQRIRQNGETLSELHEARTLTVSIGRPPGDVYDYVSDPTNMPYWSFFDSVVESGGRWLARSSAGEVFVSFVPANEYGVLDHTVELAPDQEIRVPMRVIPNGEGSELIFTVIREVGGTDDEFEQDVSTVRKDLETLKNLLEAA